MYNPVDCIKQSTSLATRHTLQRNLDMILILSPTAADTAVVVVAATVVVVEEVTVVEVVVTEEEVVDTEAVVVDLVVRNLHKSLTLLVPMLQVLVDTAKGDMVEAALQACSDDNLIVAS